MSDPLFSSDQEPVTIDPNKDYSSDLVGEGKKFKDIAALARAKVESDAFIEQLKRENAEARAKADNGLAMKTFLDNLDAKMKTAPAEPTRVETPSLEPNAAQPNKGISEQDIVALLERREAQKSEQDNLNKAVEQVKKAFGANYGLVLKQKAQELGVKEEFLTDVAKKNVNAFLKIVQAETPSDNTSLFPSSSISSSNPSVQNTGKKFKDYEKLRKENQQEYMSRKIQNEMMDEALKQGESFFS